MIVLALDPGETTGWCRVDTTGSIEGGSFPLWEDVQRYILTPFALVGGRGGPDLLIVERFMLYPAMVSRLNWSKLRVVEVIGVVKYIAEQWGGQLLMQNASVAKSVELAKKPEGFDKHACDALRHALAFLKREGLLTEELRGYIK